MKILFITLLIIFILTAPHFLLCSNQKTLDTRAHIMEMASGYIVARCIHTAAHLKIADFLVDGPQTIDVLAEKTNTHKNTLFSLLQLLASYGIFHYDKNNFFSLTPLAEQLISHDPNSLWAWIAHHHDTPRWNAYGDMQYCIETGKPSFDHLFKTDYFNFISQDPIMAHNFNEGMKNISLQEDDIIASVYNFSIYHHVTDIGGGTGNLLTAIIKKNNHLKGTLFDLLSTKNAALDNFKELALEHALNFKESTGFFSPIPKNSDLYILKRILHDWNDESCIEILKNCHNAMHDTSRLLIIECILSEPNIRDFKKDVSIEMMILFGGKERTLNEFATLLNAAGLRIIATHSTSSMMSIIEIEKIKEHE
jgi:hypothetical protein